MKKIFITSFLLLSLVVAIGAPGMGNVAHAQGYGAEASRYQYDLSFRFRNQEYNIRTHGQMQAFLQDLLAYLQELTDDTNGAYSEVEVATRSATDVSDDSARLNGDIVDFNDSDYATTWFEYGRSLYSLPEQTSSKYLDDSDDSSFDQVIDDLQEDTRYYFRAVARDDRGRNDYGSTLQFVTDTNGNEDENEDEPEATTQSAADIENDSAVLRGEVDMNDFNDGIVFFVYGEDSDLVEDIASDYDTYADIDEDGDDLQKVRVDTDLDGSDSYEVTVGSLDEDTDQYFSMCVEYEDADGDEFLTCGSVKSFSTDW